MRRFITSKRVLLPGIVVLTFASAVSAYFISTGSGTGAATVGSGSNVTLHGTVASALYPGTSATVNFTVDNPSAGSQNVNAIHLASITPDASHSSCSTAISGANPDFSMPDVTVGQSFSSGSGQAVTATGTLTMRETGVNQNACQGATLTLNLTSN